MFKSRFLTTAVLFFLFANLVSAQEKRQLIRVNTYQIKTAEKAELFDSMMESAVQALSDYGVKPIGVFKLADPDKEATYPHLRVTIAPYDDMDQIVNQLQAFNGNSSFWQDSEAYLTLEADEAAFDRVDSMLLYAFSGMPELAVPGDGKAQNRLFELRTYESYSEYTALIKVNMFNDGEIELFEKVGLPAVFYGSAIAGGNLPQLTYMLVHDDEQAQKAGWTNFIRSPEWAALQKKDPYAGKKLVSKIIKTMLVATDYSQIR